MGTPEAGKLFLERLTSLSDSPIDLTTPRNFDTTALSGIRDVTTSPGRLQCVMKVTPRVANRYGTLHGGCIATLVDTVGSAALVTQSTRSGVSLNISVDYLSPMPSGEDCEIDARVVKVGKNIATINVELRRKQTKQLVAQGTHVKFMAASEVEIKGLHEFKDLPIARSKL
ncbi:hypothetical protein WJX72_003675 [[Myrmecia] bisecta]|uniref:Acyl-coenzyme A thioesterase 13 n=1 Tax=[Myrmecia] bisecta TaxID=41462 RepID=A0AAW1PGZ9_9CHLO